MMTEPNICSEECIPASSCPQYLNVSKALGLVSLLKNDSLHNICNNLGLLPANSEESIKISTSLKSQTCGTTDREEKVCCGIVDREVKELIQLILP